MASPYALDFSPINEAINSNRQFDLARNKLAMEQERLGFERELQPFRVDLQKQAVSAGADEAFKRKAQALAGFIQTQKINDPSVPPAERAANWDKVLSHPMFANDPGLAHPAYGKLLRDPNVGPGIVLGIARGYQDEEKEALLKAERLAKESEANRNGYMVSQPGTDIVKLPNGAAAPSPNIPTGAGPAQRPGIIGSDPRYGGVAQPPQANSTTGGAQVVHHQPLRPPPGYEPDPGNPGQFRPMVGGPADIKFTEAKNKAQFSVQSSAAKMDDLIQNIDELQKHPGLKGNFGLQGVLPNIPGSQSSDAFAKLQQLKAQGGFAMLQAMREASKTGGALGNVSDAEGARLEASFGALQRASSLPQAMQELQKIRAQVQRSKDMMVSAFQSQYGSGTPAQTPTRSVGGTGKPIGEMGLDDLRKLSPMSLTPEQKKAAADRWDELMKPSAGAP